MENRIFDSPVIASLDHPLFASRKEGFFYISFSSPSLPLAVERVEHPLASVAHSG
jgi:hypothetical protein